MVAAVIAGQQLSGVGRIPEHGREISGSVERAAGENPVIDGLAKRVAFGCPVRGALVWLQRRPDDLDSARVRDVDQPPVGTGEVTERQGRVGADIVGALPDNDRLHVRLVDRVADEAVQRALA
jgi:hypothetical protein